MLPSPAREAIFGLPLGVGEGLARSYRKDCAPGFASGLGRREGDWRPLLPLPLLLPLLAVDSSSSLSRESVSGPSVGDNDVGRSSSPLPGRVLELGRLLLRLWLPLAAARDASARTTSIAEGPKGKCSIAPTPLRTGIAGTRGGVPRPVGLCSMLRTSPPGESSARSRELGRTGMDAEVGLEPFAASAAAVFGEMAEGCGC